MASKIGYQACCAVAVDARRVGRGLVERTSH
jgi:hypothetical protein